MKLRLPIAAAVTLVVVSSVSAQKPAAVKKSDSVVKVKAKAEKPAADGTQTVVVTVAIEKPWHLYANPVGNDDLRDAQTVLKVIGPDKPKTLKVEYPKSKLVQDAVVGDYRIFEGEIVIKAKIERVSGPLEVELKLQACTDKACLPPATVKVKVDGV